MRNSQSLCEDQEHSPQGVESEEGGKREQSPGTPLRVLYCSFDRTLCSGVLLQY